MPDKMALWTALSLQNFSVVSFNQSKSTSDFLKPFIISFIAPYCSSLIFLSFSKSIKILSFVGGLLYFSTKSLLQEK